MFGPDGDFYVFRGHQKSSWSLSSTFARFSTSKFVQFRGAAFEYLINRFEEGLASIGNRDMAGMDIRRRLEFARRHGVPSPLIDVTRSPFIALWFAFSGVKGSVDKGRAALYAINWNYLGVAYSALANSKGWEDSIREKYRVPSIDMFRWEIKDFFGKGYPQPALKFIPYASSANTKVQRQMGCFLYDTLIYADLGVPDLETLIGEHEICMRVGANRPIVIKYLIPYSLAGKVFSYLDILGINGARLMDDYTGAAADVLNTFNHNPRGRSFDIGGIMANPDGNIDALAPIAERHRRGGRKRLAQLAFFCDALVRLRLVVDAIFELAIPFGQQPCHDVQAARDASTLWRKLHGLPDLELVPAYLSGGLIQSTQ